MIVDLLYNSKRKSETKIEEKNKTSSIKASNEGLQRSLIKTISWRLIGTLDTVIISYFIVGKLSMALSIGSIELLSKMILYFFHERAWNIIKWGK